MGGGSIRILFPEGSEDHLRDFYKSNLNPVSIHSNSFTIKNIHDADTYKAINSSGNGWEGGIQSKIWLNIKMKWN